MQPVETLFSPARLFLFEMYLLYLDDAGFVATRNERHFVLAGIALNEHLVLPLHESLNQLVRSLGHPNPAALEIHGNAILNGRGWWRRIRREERRAIIRLGLMAAPQVDSSQWCLFGAVVDKEAVYPQDPVESAFMHIVDRFSCYLQGRQQDGPDTGLVIMDDTSYEPRLQALAAEKRALDIQSESKSSIVEVPLFVNSKATRGIQYADLVAYALWRKYEKGDSDFFDVIADWFDSEGGVVHGLHHYRNRDKPCDCPACLSRY